MHIPPRNPKINDTAPYVVQNVFDGLDCFIDGGSKYGCGF